MAEKETYTLDQMLCSGLKPLFLIFSKALFYGFVAIVELSISLPIAYWGYNLSPAASLFPLYIMTYIMGYSMSCIGMLIALMCRNRIQAVYIFIFILVLMIMLSTIIPRLETMMTWWAYMRFANPLYWIVDGAKGIMLRGFGFNNLAINYLGLIVICTILTIVEIKKLEKISS